MSSGKRAVAARALLSTAWRRDARYLVALCAHEATPNTKRSIDSLFYSLVPQFSSSFLCTKRPPRAAATEGSNLLITHPPLSARAPTLLPPLAGEGSSAPAAT
jgi:hypothetical protein